MQNKIHPKFAILASCLVFGLLTAQPGMADKRSRAKLGHRVVHPAAKQGFNPQPEPPGRIRGGYISPGAKQGFNPQPEPPGRTRRRYVSPGAKQGFNPQPEPPGKQRTF